MCAHCSVLQHFSDNIHSDLHGTTVTDVLENSMEVSVSAGVVARLLTGAQHAVSGMLLL